MWQKLTPKNVVGSVWENLNDEKVKIDTAKLETLFGADPPVAAKPKAETVTKVVTVSLLDPKRANNIEIMLKALKMNHIEIRDALRNLDSEVLNVDKLRAMKTNIPTPDELALISNYDGEPADLGNAEQYFRAIKEIPLLELRINGMEYMATFDAKTNELLQSIDSLLKASVLLKSEKKISRASRAHFGARELLKRWYQQRRDLWIQTDVAGAHRRAQKLFSAWCDAHALLGRSFGGGACRLPAGFERKIWSCSRSCPREHNRCSKISKRYIVGIQTSSEPTGKRSL